MLVLSAVNKYAHGCPSSSIIAYLIIAIVAIDCFAIGYFLRFHFLRRHCLLRFFAIDALPLWCLLLIGIAFFRFSSLMPAIIYIYFFSFPFFLFRHFLPPRFYAPFHVVICFRAIFAPFTTPRAILLPDVLMPCYLLFSWYSSPRLFRCRQRLMMLMLTALMSFIPRRWYAIFFHASCFTPVASKIW